MALIKVERAGDGEAFEPCPEDQPCDIGILNEGHDAVTIQDQQRAAHEARDLLRGELRRHLDEAVMEREPRHDDGERGHRHEREGVNGEAHAGKEIDEGQVQHADRKGHRAEAATLARACSRAAPGPHACACRH